MPCEMVIFLPLNFSNLLYFMEDLDCFETVYIFIPTVADVEYIYVLSWDIFSAYTVNRIYFIVGEN